MAGRTPGPLGELDLIIRGQKGTGAADADLLARFLERQDEAAFETLLWRHGPMVLSVCRRVLRDSHAADDAFQATFLILVRKGASIGKRQALASWLYKVAYRVALQARAAKDPIATASLEDVPAPAANTESAWLPIQPYLDEAIQKLCERYRLPVVLFYLEGKLVREIAEQLNCPIPTITSRLRRARELLRRRLARHLAPLSDAALGSALTSEGARASVSPLLARLTSRTAMLLAAGAAPNVTRLSVAVGRLLQANTRNLLPIKLAAIAVTLITLGSLAVGSLTMRLGRVVPREGARKALPHDEEAGAAAQAAKGSMGRDVVVQGRVFGPDGKPLSGARLLFPHLLKETPQKPEDIQVAQRGTTDGRGEPRRLEGKRRPWNG